MEPKGNFKYWINNFRSKHRLSLQSEHEHQEVWYMHISPLKLLASLLALILVLFVIVVTTVAYTPLLDYIPGYPGNKSREMLIQNIMRLDSLERELSSMTVYSDNVALIMEGKTPVVRSVTGSQLDTIKNTGQITPRSAADSLMRSQMEGAGPYRLNEAPPGARELALIAPVKGVLATRFAPKEGRYGVGLTTTSGEQVVAVKEGTVTLAVWAPNDGHVVQVQHTDNLVSTYKHLSSVLPAIGSRVKAGEVVGYTGEGMFELELWINGVPVNPETYIVF